MMYPAFVVKHSDDAATVPGTVPLVGRIDGETMNAFRRWADAEERTLAAQLRIVLRNAIPENFYEGDHE